MKHTLILLTALLLAPLAAHAQQAAPDTVRDHLCLFGCPPGSDTNPGTEAKPLATLERARDAARQQGEP